MNFCAQLFFVIVKTFVEMLDTSQEYLQMHFLEVKLTVLVKNVALWKFTQFILVVKRAVLRALIITLQLRRGRSHTASAQKHPIRLQQTIYRS